MPQQVLLAQNKITKATPMMTIGSDELVISPLASLKKDMHIPRSAIATIYVQRHDGPFVDPTTYARVPRLLRFPIGTGAPAILWVVLRAPALVNGFKLGVNRVLAISARERRKGVLLDAVGFDVDNPERVLRKLRDEGVESTMEPDRVWTQVLGPAL
jgi:hypothetical protein